MPDPFDDESDAAKSPKVEGFLLEANRPPLPQVRESSRTSSRNAHVCNLPRWASFDAWKRTWNSMWSSAESIRVISAAWMSHGSLALWINIDAWRSSIVEARSSCRLRAEPVFSAVKGVWAQSSSFCRKHASVLSKAAGLGACICMLCLVLNLISHMISHAFVQRPHHAKVLRSRPAAAILFNGTYKIEAVTPAGQDAPLAVWGLNVGDSNDLPVKWYHGDYETCRSVGSCDFRITSVGNERYKIEAKSAKEHWGPLQVHDFRGHGRNGSTVSWYNGSYDTCAAPGCDFYITAINDTGKYQIEAVGPRKLLFISNSTEPGRSGLPLEVYNSSAETCSSRECEFDIASLNESETQEQGAGDIVEFYLYRATRHGDIGRYPFGNINLANMDGVMWYLMNEVVTMYTRGSRCPRKFNISEIHRFKIRLRATKELVDEGMNMGARFSYDFGKCMGRCFPNNLCSDGWIYPNPDGSDCDYHYARYGHTVGCNRFTDNYPFPINATAVPNGIWYSLPLLGRCENPTGGHFCTWSYEHAGMISLASLEAVAPSENWGNCCDGRCTQFWESLFDTWKTSWRVKKALDLFASKYPGMPRDLNESWCDFQWQRWYAHDKWQHRDPWVDPNKVQFK